MDVVLIRRFVPTWSVWSVRSTPALERASVTSADAVPGPHVRVPSVKTWKRFCASPVTWAWSAFTWVSVPSTRSADCADAGACT